MTLWGRSGTSWEADPWSTFRVRKIGRWGKGAPECPGKLIKRVYTKMCQFPLELAPPIFLADSVAAPLIFFPAISVPIHPLSDDDSVRLEASSEEEVGGFGARCSFPLKNYRSATVTMKIIKSNTKSHYCLSCFAQCCSLRWRQVFSFRVWRRQKLEAGKPCLTFDSWDSLGSHNTSTLT